MESKARPLLVGVFTVVFAIGMIAFVVWLVKAGFMEDHTRYRVIFEDSAAGLSEGSAVRVSGIDVGKVQTIHLGVDRPTQVPVVIGVRSDLTLHEGVYATKETLGITGATYIALHPVEDRDAPALAAPEGEDLPVIPTRGSGGLSAVMETLPAVARDIRAMVARVDSVLSEERLARIDTILDNVAETAAQGPEVMQGVRTTVRDAQAALITAERAADAARSTFATTETLLEDDVAAVVAEARDAAESLDAAAGRVQQVVGQAAPGLSDFADQGLTEARFLISEARQTVDELRQLAARLQDNPNALVFGEAESTFDPEDR